MTMVSNGGKRSGSGSSKSVSPMKRRQSGPERYLSGCGKKRLNSNE
jgi:hypothetical protein